MNNPLVSFIIPVFNFEEYLRDSVESCLRQTYNNIEIMIINDGSDDNSRIIAEELADNNKNVKLINIIHSGKVKAINIGVQCASGKFLAIHAADDVCYNYRISKQLEEIIKDENNVLCYGDYDITDQNLSILDSSCHIEKNEISTEMILYQNVIPGGTMLINAKFKDKIFPIPSILSFEDWWISFISTLYGTIVSVDDKIIMYRQHNRNAVGSRLTYSKRRTVDIRKRDFLRHFDYYSEMTKYLNEHEIRCKKQYIGIINFNILKKRLFLASNIMERYYIFKQQYKKTDYLNFKKIVELLILTIVGDKYNR